MKMSLSCLKPQKPLNLNITLSGLYFQTLQDYRRLCELVESTFDKMLAHLQDCYGDKSLKTVSEAF